MLEGKATAATKKRDGAYLHMKPAPGTAQPACPPATGLESAQFAIVEILVQSGVRNSRRRTWQSGPQTV